MLTNIAKVYPVLRNWPFHLTGVSFNPVTCANVHACLKKKPRLLFKRDVLPASVCFLFFNDGVIIHFLSTFLSEST